MAEKRDMKSQLLDSMDPEREKGITIACSGRMNYKEHELNLTITLPRRL